MSFQSAVEDVQNICRPEMNSRAQSTIVEPDLQQTASGEDRPGGKTERNNAQFIST